MDVPYPSTDRKRPPDCALFPKEIARVEILVDWFMDRTAIRADPEELACSCRSSAMFRSFTRLAESSRDIPSESAL